jgi:hypothetical protein
MPPIDQFTSAEVAERWAKSARECDKAIQAIQREIDAADRALLDAGMRSDGSLADRITRLATQRDALLVDKRLELVSERCPSCGYTELDALEIGDHRICDRYPFFTFEGESK